MHRTHIYSLIQYYNDVLDLEIILSVILYASIFVFSCYCCYMYEKCNLKINSLNKLNRNNVLWLLAAIFPMALLYGLRYNVGTDYRNYVEIYNSVKSIDCLLDCFAKFRYESLFLILNYLFSRVFDDSFWLFIFIGVLITALFWWGVYRFRQHLILPLCLFMFYTDMFFYATNGVRFSIGSLLVFVGFYYLYNNYIFKYCFFVILASLFHNSLLLCLFFVVLIQFRNKRFNKIRDIIFVFFIIFSPFLIKECWFLFEYLPVVSYYFSKYKYYLSEVNVTGLGFIRLAPIFILLLIYRKRLINIDKNNKMLFFIAFCKIPFFYASYYIRWAGRFQRLSDFTCMLLISMLFKYLPQNKSKRVLLSFFIVYLLLNFVYSYMLVGSSDIFPYRSILENTIY